MKVYIQNIKNEGYYYGGAQGTITINRNLFEGGYQSARVKPLLAHEFFHFVQFNYVTPGTDNLWFDEATATYFEYKVSGNIPAIVMEHHEKIFAGVFPPENTAAHGYARMPLIHYLAGRRGEDFIRKAYVMVKEGVGWEDAIRSTTGPPANWVGDFYTALVKGEVSHYRPHTLHSILVKSEWSEIGTPLALVIPAADKIAARQDYGQVPVLGETTLSVDGLGAKLVALTISDTELKKLPDARNPVVSVEGNAELVVLAVRGPDVQVLKSAGGEVELADFKKEAGQQTRFLLLVVGLHEGGKADYKVSVKTPLYPPLDELVGVYEDGTLTYDEVYISDAFKTAAQEANEADFVANLQALEGQTESQPLVVLKTAEDAGFLVVVPWGVDPSHYIDYPDPEDGILFTYKNGVMTFQHRDEVEDADGELSAAYGKNNDVTINGQLVLNHREGIRRTVTIKGSKPLEKSVP
jgi:hypothetical protein